jgi:hypothetical protein
MSGRFLLDTNIVIALWANDATATHHLALASEVFVPIIVGLRQWIRITPGGKPFPRSLATV